MANKSPPMPFAYGCITPSAALAAMAASIALPPASSIFAPACEARKCEAATIPYFVTTMDRAWSREECGGIFTEGSVTCARCRQATAVHLLVTTHGFGRT